MREAADTCTAGCFGCEVRSSVQLVQLKTFMSQGEGLDLELAVPEDSDMQELTDLVDESFQRAIQARPDAARCYNQSPRCSRRSCQRVYPVRMVDGGNPLGDLWNGWVSLSERQMTLGAMRKRLAGLLSSPSLRRKHDHFPATPKQLPISPRQAAEQR